MPTNEIESVLEQLDTPKNDIVLEVGGHSVKFSSLRKVLWPETEHSPAFTKRDLAVYYARMSEYLLKHLRDRPISFVRLPEGLGGERFFQKHWEKGLPEWIETVPIYSSSNDTRKPYVLINQLGTLMWLAQMSSLEIHPWYSRVVPDAGAEDRPTDTGGSEDALDASPLNYPDFMVIDLDPMVKAGHEAAEDEPALNRTGWQMCVDVAGGVKELLDGIGLRAYPKTSGKAGLHLYVPLRRIYEYETVRTLCETLGRFVEKSMPDKVTMEWVVKKRPEKVFFDHNQNVRGKTLSGAFTVRAVPGAPVSMPITWDQVRTIYPTDFTIQTAPAFMATHKDPGEGILDDRQVLPGS
jgi:bifunctional non-homologous end joining protein LigD